LPVGAVPEIKPDECRAALTPTGVEKLRSQGSPVYIGAGLGVASGYPDLEYERAGATILHPDEVWKNSVLIVGVKEPWGDQVDRIRQGDLEGKLYFAYFHLAHPRASNLLSALVEGGVTVVAYETVSRERSGGDNRLEFDLLKPMSAIAGTIAAQKVIQLSMAPEGGIGQLLGLVEGIKSRRGKVAIFGGGTVGIAAAVRLLGMGADVDLFEVNLHRIRELEQHPILSAKNPFGGTFRIIESKAEYLDPLLPDYDGFIGAVYKAGETAPRILSEEQIRQTKAGAVFVDVSSDQGGNFEGSHPTTHDDPVFSINGRLFYCVTNMPGAVPRTSTPALTEVTLPYVLALAKEGLDVIKRDPALRRGLNVHRGKVTNKGVADAHGYCYVPIPMR